MKRVHYVAPKTPSFITQTMGTGNSIVVAEVIRGQTLFNTAQRGNNRQACFVTDEDHDTFSGLLEEYSKKEKVDMPD